jgi:hypothetical protein
MQVRFSTDDLPPRDRVRFWCDYFAKQARSITPSEIPAPGAFRAEASGSVAGGFALLDHCCPVHGDRIAQKWLSHKDFSMILGGVDLNSVSAAGAALPPDLANFLRKEDRRGGFGLHIGGHPFAQSISKTVDGDIGFKVGLLIRNGNVL